MMSLWDERGVKFPVTVVQLDECVVTKVNKFLSGRGNPRVNLQLGAVPRNPKWMNKAELCLFRSRGLDPKRKLAEFPVSEDGVLPVGTKITARHFVAGQYIDIQGKSKGKGFSGGMKRWGFKGQGASHGVSLTHRHIGSTGACQWPGKVWKGKKMPGHNGNRKCTFLNMQIYKIDVKRNLLFIKGSIPGANNTCINIKDAVRKPFRAAFPPPYPTYAPEAGDEDVDEIIMDVSHLDNPFC